MLTRRILLIVLAFLAACGGEGQPEVEPAQPIEPGATPRETVEALIGCVEQDRLADVWNLLSAGAREVFPEAQESLRDTFASGRDLRSPRREIEAKFGMTIEEFSALPARDALAVCLERRTRFDPEATPLARLKGARYESENLDPTRKRCNVLLRRSGETAKAEVLLVREGDVWVLPDWEEIVSLRGGLVAGGSSRHQMRDKVACLNNLRNIGGMLVADSSGSRKFRYSGPAFLLQIAPKIKDAQLKVFICPAEPDGAAPDRPPLGSPEFVRMYRELDLDKVQDWSKYTSYAGPNWKDHPYNPASTEVRYWACCRCAGGKSYHGGVALLRDDGSAKFVTDDEIERPEGSTEIRVGPDATDARLRKMFFNRDR